MKKLLLATILVLACAAGLQPEYSLCYTNGHKGPISVVKMEHDKIVGEYPIDYSRDLAVAWSLQDAVTNDAGLFSQPEFWLGEHCEFGPSRLKFSHVLSTNWTGATTKDGEVGLIVTNHVLHVEYKGTTNDFTLLTVDSGRHVFRLHEPAIIVRPFNPTNTYFWTTPPQSLTIPLLTNWSIVQ